VLVAWWIGLPILMVVAAGVGLDVGWQWLRDNRAWVKDVDPETESRLPHMIFDRAVAAGLIRADVDQEGIKIHVASCENRVARVSDDNAANAAQANPAILSLLCTTAQGEEIKQEIEQWNNSYHLIAVRDNRVQPDTRPGMSSRVTCDDGEDRPGQVKKPQRLATAYIPKGCIINTWQAEHVLGTKRFPVDVWRDDEPPYAEFAMLSDEDHLFFGDWAVVPREPRADAIAEYYRLWDKIKLPASGKIAIDLIGRPAAITVDGATLKIDPKFPDTPDDHPARLASTTVDITLQCSNRDLEVTDDCEHIPDVPIPYGTSFEISGRPNQLVEIAIEVSPLENVPRSVFTTSTTAKASAPATFNRSAHISAECQYGDSPVQTCKLIWNPLKPRPHGNRNF